ncbi:hypothetical protein LC040_02350 [Bacillus tianshenii]|nr:hypothetical protein LC040_02350 [Bacillus tianshenii]
MFILFVDVNNRRINVPHIEEAIERLIKDGDLVVEGKRYKYENLVIQNDLLVITLR